MISLIIPTLNEAQLLPQTLKLLDKATRQKFAVELIVSDGGSKDGTPALARKLGAKVISSKKGVKQNIAVGRNAGAAVARGRVLIFLDADTKPRSWPELFSAAQQLLLDKKAVAAAPRFAIAPAERKIADIFWLNFYNLIIFIQNYLGLGYGRGNCQIIKTESFWQAGGYNPDLPAAEDFDLYKRLRKLGRIKNLWGVLVYESPRRYRRYGYLKVNKLYLFNALSLIWRGKAWSKRWPRVK